MLLKTVKKYTRGKAGGTKKDAESAEERQARIAEQAYYLAEKRGFCPGQELDDWFMAENMLDAGAARGAKG